MGLSHPGSWPIHTPLATSAITVQPTEQWVQKFFRNVTCAPAGGGGPASALRTEPSGRLPSAARLPAARPERRRNVRRSKFPDWRGSASASGRRCVSRSLRLISIDLLLPYGYRLT